MLLHLFRISHLKKQQRKKIRSLKFFYAFFSGSLKLSTVFVFCMRREKTINADYLLIHIYSNLVFTLREVRFGDKKKYLQIISLRIYDERIRGAVKCLPTTPYFNQCQYLWAFAPH